jgi:hypothetical protein
MRREIMASETHVRCVEPLVHSATHMHGAARANCAALSAVGLLHMSGMRLAKRIAGAGTLGSRRQAEQLIKDGAFAMVYQLSREVA